MSKGYSGLFHGTAGSNANSNNNEGNTPENGIDYNSADSKSVRKVETVVTTKDAHSISSHGTPNSVSRNYKHGQLDSERYYDKDGKAYLDIDYSNHGNSKTHPNVPHEHTIHFDQDGKMHRDDEPEGGLNR